MKKLIEQPIYFFRLAFEKGDKVAIHLHNSPELLISWFGLAKIGAIMVPINVQYLYDECAYIVEKCQPKAVVIEKEFFKYL